MKVLHVAQPVDGGVANVVKGLVSFQLCTGVEAVVASPAGDLADAVVEAGAQHVLWDATRAPSAATAGEVARLRRIVDDCAPDVLHLHSTKAGLAGRLAVRGRRPTVFQPHAWGDLAAAGPVRTLVRRWERAARRWTDEVIVGSAAEAEHGVDLGVHPLALVPNGVDVERFAPRDRNAARERVGIEAGVPVAVCVARLARQKGQDLLLDAWATGVRRSRPDARLILVGDGPDRELLVDRARQLDVRLVPDCDDPRDWYAAADVVVMPSRWEGASLVLVEAMAMGRSVVGFDVGGLGTTLANAGAAVRPGEVHRLASAVLERLASSELCGTEGASNRRRAVSSFSAGRAYAAMTDIERRWASR
jgi:glycosyltransferase involved in cell wall biosynthesis